MKTFLSARLAWRQWSFNLGYWRCALFYGLIAGPVVWLTAWLSLFCGLPRLIGSPLRVDPYVIIWGPLCILWVIPGILTGLFAWPMFWLGLALESPGAELARPDSSEKKRGVT